VYDGGLGFAVDEMPHLLAQRAVFAIVSLRSASQLMKNDSLDNPRNKVAVVVSTYCIANSSHFAQLYGSNDWLQLAKDMESVYQAKSRCLCCWCCSLFSSLQQLDFWFHL
jgi:hypothetical protein